MSLILFDTDSMSGSMAVWVIEIGCLLVDLFQILHPVFGQSNELGWIS